MGVMTVPLRAVTSDAEEGSEHAAPSFEAFFTGSVLGSSVHWS